jgi:molybdenum cofactor biosynthesis enzyme MoaA
MCNQRQMDLTKVTELPLAEIRQIAAKLVHMGARHIVLTGGEPFMRKDLSDIVAAFSEHNFSVRVQTNGGPQVSYKRLA